MGFWRTVGDAFKAFSAFPYSLLDPARMPQMPLLPLPPWRKAERPKQHPFAGLLLSVSPLVEDGKVLLKRNGQVVGYGSISELETAKDEVFDELVLSPSDFHAVRERCGGPIP